MVTETYKAIISRETYMHMVATPYGWSISQITSLQRPIAAAELAIVVTYMGDTVMVK